jgi:ABC-type nitrate/sulfonate/bicarbonate transport system substrate-binding protein
VLAALVALAALTACGSNSSSDTAAGASESPGAKNVEQLSIKIGSPLVTGSMPYQVGIEKGFFKAEGLDASIISTLSGAALPAAVMSDAIQVGSSTVANVALLKQQNTKARIIAANLKAPTFLVVVPTGSKIPIVGQNGATWQDTVKALEGKKIAGFGVGSAQDVELITLFKVAKLSTQYTAVNAVGNGAQLAIIKGNQVDAMVVGSGTAYTAEAQGLGKIALDMSTQGPPEVTGQAFAGVVASDAYLSAHPDFAPRFRKALYAATAWLKDPANKDEVLAMTEKFTGLSKSDPSTWAAIEYENRLRTETFEAKGIQATFDSMTLTGQLAAAPVLKPEDVVDAAIIK